MSSKVVLFLFCFFSQKKATIKQIFKMHDWLVSVEMKCSCSFEGAPEVGLLNYAAGEGKLLQPGFLQSASFTPLISLHHTRTQHLVHKHKYTSRESGWRKTTMF